MTRTSLYALAALAALCLAPLPAQAQELIANGGFETGDFTGWTLTNDAYSSVAGGFVNSGSYAAFLGAVGSDGALSQTIATVPGQSYTFSFAFAGHADFPCDFSASFGPDCVFSVSDPAFDALYVPYSFTVVATGSATPVTFLERDDIYFINLDDVSVTPLAAAPEPSSGTAFAVGVLGLAALALRKRSV